MSFEQLYSYHTFTLPFVWKGKKKAQSDFVHFARCFENSSSWVDTNLHDGLATGENVWIRNLEDAYSFYKEYQYFSPHVRNALYGFDDSVVRAFTFKPYSIQNKGHYYIQKDQITYDLLINAINLVIYNTGVALFIMECENHGKSVGGESQDNLAAVKKINDYGRRINLPIIPAKGGGFSLCADSLTVEVLGERYETNFKEFAETVKDKSDILQLHSMSYICNFIKEILGSGCEYRFTTNSNYVNKDENMLLIYPALDDRMFVNCYVCDAAETNSMRLKTKDGDYCFNADESLSKSLYEFIFIDTDGNCSCMSQNMRKELLDSHVYKRWLDQGSIYAIAAQSFVMLTNFNADFLLESFLTQYMRMSSLALVQRASLMLFERELADISVDSATKTNRRLRRSTIVRIMDIRERFIAYQSQLGFTEISSQEQAIELWDMLRESFQIDKQTEALSKRMDDLKDAADTSLSFSINIIGLVFTVFTAIGIISDLLSTDEAIMTFWGVFGLDMEKSTSVLMMSPRSAYIVVHVAVYLFTWLAIKFIYRRRK